MGIQGLIPFLEKATRRANIGDFAGCCVAIDAYCWLHKGAYTCVEKLARGEPCDAYVYYCMKFVNMLLSHNIKPILVFDGRNLPAKAMTEKKRRENRQSCRKRAAELLRAGKPDEARNFLRRCIDVTHKMALALIKECRRHNVDCIVAPYEADAQLAYLNMQNIAQIVITEDSDLVLFGCSKIMFKMDVFGNGLLLDEDRLHLAMKVRPENFSFDKFRYMCILSGCDYLASLPGIGLVKACKFVTKTSDPDIRRALSRLPGYLNMRSLTMTDEYRDDFMLADATFRHQVVFDPLTRSLTRLSQPPDDQPVTDYAGTMLPSDQAYQLALGNLNPHTLEKVDSYDPDLISQVPSARSSSWKQVNVAPHVSIWSRNYKLSVVKPRPDPREVERPFTKGRVVVKTMRVSQQQEPCEGVSDEDLISLYKQDEPPTKKHKPDNRPENEDEIEPCSSPEHDETPIPAEDDIKFRDEITFSSSPGTQCTSSPTESISSPVKDEVAATKAVSPVLNAGKSRRNPFFKQLSSASPNENKLLGLRDVTSSEVKFSAINKFNKLRHTDIDDTVLVHSRFFEKQSKTSDAHDKSLKDVSNSVNSSCVTPTKQECVASTKFDSSKLSQNTWNDKFKFKKNTHLVTKQFTSQLDEEAVDDPSDRTSVSFTQDCEAVDEGFHSPSTSRLSQSLTHRPKTCRRLGLSKSTNKQSLLTMFGFQSK
ncbi:hypothetical protein L9F63_014597 [Diploptera punctata]|uniref:Exonuclease 1 n=1 Tax=Diploptera punctata TaxID=6984 RepID=A0AAD8A8D8_DIPPU|nr:hypothetical protein L9F63_014597 [Diploptera punctata]